MTAYYLLILFIFLAAGIIYSLPIKTTSKNLAFTRIVFIYIYFFCVLRSFSVGIDIPGYIRMYDETANVAWDNWDYVYFENGYITLMKICNYIGLSARGFFYVIYAIILWPIYYVIRKYSIFPLLSVLLYITFLYFVFDLTGLRQAVGMSICLLAFTFLINNSWRNCMLFYALTALAITFHISAAVFLPAYFLARLNLNKRIIIFFIVAFVLCYVFNRIGVQTFLGHGEREHYQYDDDLRLGLSLVIYFLFALFGIWTNNNLCKSFTYLRHLNGVCTLMIMAGIAASFLFNGSILLRSTMYYLLVFILSVPLFFKTFELETRLIGVSLLITVFLFHFFTSELSSFDVTPYTIGIDQAITK